MARKVKSVREKLANETYGDAIALGADASNVDLTNGSNVQDTLDNVTQDISAMQNNLTWKSV